MSTKINVRSPFFLDLTEPVQTLGIFTCTTAGLSNFSVASSGFVTNPFLLLGNIVDQTATEFPINTTGSSIPRSVTYTIAIPEYYTNVKNATIDCVQTFLQPTQAANENPVTNDNCPTFAGTIPSSSGLASTAIALSSGATPYFTSGSDADISSYSVTKSPSGAAVDAVLTGTAPNQTLTLSSSTDCQLATFIVTARQSSDSCTAISNSFTFASANCGAYDCNAANVVGGSIEQDGTVNKGTHTLGTLNELLYLGTDITSSLNAGANNTGSPVNKTITYRFNIPNGYSNSGTFNCDVVYSQPSTQVLPTFDCDAIQASGGFISEQGNIAPPTLGAGTLVSWTPQGFGEVSLNTPQTIYLTVSPPASGYANSGGADITPPCPYIITQPATFPECGLGTTVNISRQAYNTPYDACVFVEIGNFNFGQGSPATFAEMISTIGWTICQRFSAFAGDNKYYAVTERFNTLSTQSNFYLLKIDNYGTVQEVWLHNCSGGGTGAGARIR